MDPNEGWTFIDGAPRVPDILPDLSLQDVKNKYKKDFDVLENPFVCSACNTVSSLLQALGQRGCWIHPSKKIDGVWQCCNRNANDENISGRIPGCTAADHRSTALSLTEADDIRIPYAIYIYMNPRPDPRNIRYSAQIMIPRTHLVDAHRSYVVVTRFDVSS